MKNKLSRSSFVFSDYDGKQTRQSWFVAILLIVMFAFTAFTFMNALYAFSDSVGSAVSGSMDVMVRGLLRSIPLYLSLFISIWSLLLVHAFFRNVSEEKLRKSIYKNAIAVICFAVINIGYVVVGLFTGRYLSLFEGSPSPLFPFDSIVFSGIFLILAIIALVVGGKMRTKKIYVVPNRAPVARRARFFYCLGVAIWMLFALFCTGAFFMGLFIIDFVHGYLLYSVALLVVFFVNFIFLGFWEFYYNELKEECRKHLLLPLAIVGLLVAAAAAGFYFFALSKNLDGPSNVGFGVLPVAFAASVNIATLLVVAVPVLVSLIALIKGIVLKAKK